MSNVRAGRGKGLRQPSRREAWHLLQADSTQSTHVRLDLSPLYLASSVGEDPSMPGARERVHHRTGRRQLLVERLTEGDGHCLHLPTA
jgi:hypothetical protein